jgi:hypothetical protein
MKKLIDQNKFYFLIVLLSFLSGSYGATAQEKEEAENTRKIVSLRYFNNSNQNQYLLLAASTKNSKGVLPQINKFFTFYINSNDPANLIGTISTNSAGKAKVFIPPSLKTIWDASSHHIFMAIADEGTDDEQSQEIEIIKSKISIDTINEDGVRSITAKVLKLEDDNWIPAPDIEMKIGIKRLGGILTGGEELTYTTDSSGSVIVQLNKDRSPGDEKGNLILAAKVEDNDELGNLYIETTANWGIPLIADKKFFEQRTLWSTRFRTPFWLLGIAYTIIFGVWGTLIYLIFQIFKIKKLGRTTS